MNKEEIQSVMNSTFAGLAFFCRDTNLENDLSSKYQVNQILLERGFTDVSHKIGGLHMNCRYLIASSKGKDISMMSPNPEVGHIMIQSSAYFKVLDIQKANDKTQILLLNIPKEGVEIFSKAKINIEDQVIEKASDIFKKSLESEPVKELQSNNWLERTSFPIGMNKEGVFFLEMSTIVKPNSEIKKNVKSKSESLNSNQASKLNEKSTVKKMEAVKKKGFWNRIFGK